MLFMKKKIDNNLKVSTTGVVLLHVVIVEVQVVIIIINNINCLPLSFIL